MLRANHGDAAVSAVEKLVEAASELGSNPTIGTNIRNPRLSLNFKTAGSGKTYQPLVINSRSSGKVGIPLRWLANHAAFADENRRAEFRRSHQSGDRRTYRRTTPRWFPWLPRESSCQTWGGSKAR